MTAPLPLSGLTCSGDQLTDGITSCVGHAAFEAQAQYPRPGGHADGRPPDIGRTQWIAIMCGRRSSSCRRSLPRASGSTRSAFEGETDITAIVAPGGVMVSFRRSSELGECLSGWSELARM